MDAVSIRFKVRGGFRHDERYHVYRFWVSIRFKVRGGFRLVVCSLWCSGSFGPFQSALRFAVVSDEHERHECCYRDGFQSALRFAVVSDEQPINMHTIAACVSIRFKVRGGFRPYPLARRPDKPCCGGFTHHPSSPPPTSGQNLS